MVSHWTDLFAIDKDVNYSFEIHTKVSDMLYMVLLFITFVLVSTCVNMIYSSFRQRFNASGFDAARFMLNLSNNLYGYVLQVLTSNSTFGRIFGASSIRFGFHEIIFSSESSSSSDLSDRISSEDTVRSDKISSEDTILSEDYQSTRSSFSPLAGNGTLFSSSNICYIPCDGDLWCTFV